MRKAIPWVAGLAWLATATAAIAGAAPCRYSAPRNVDLDAATLSSLLLNLGSTDAHVQGVDGLERIEIRGTACASNPRWLDDLRIDASRNGSQATVTMRTDHGSIFSLFGAIRSYAYIKLSVSVPPALAVAIHSGSGDVVAASLASLDFHTGSGDLQAQRITGPLSLALGSGDVQARGVGSVALSSTGSGDVSVNDINGDVRADRSGSGNLSFSDVRGNVAIGSVGSGDLRLDDIGGNVRVDAIGSGDLVVGDVTGNLQVGASGSGDVSYHDVKGSVHVPMRNR